MASTRQPPPLQVYQDPVDQSSPQDQTRPQPGQNASTTEQHNGLQPSQTSQPSQPSLVPLKPLRNATANPDFALSPTTAPSSDSYRRPSPVKNQQPRMPTATTPSGSPQSGPGYVPISAPNPPSFPTDSPAKRPQPHSYYTAYPGGFDFEPYTGPPSIAHHALFTTFPSVPAGYQLPQAYPSNANVNANPGVSSGVTPGVSAGVSSGASASAIPGVSAYPGYNPYAGQQEYRPPSSSGPAPGAPITGKRTLMEAAPLKERPAKKQKREEPETVQLPDPGSLPSVEDDGDKPPYSYAVLIGMAILRSPNRRLTLAQIYKWISESFSYYRAGDSGWQNSIRHNLSLNKAFIKRERPKDDPGKGNYWAIEPGMEAQFLKEKPLRRPATMATMPLPMPPPSTSRATEQPKSELKSEHKPQQAAVNATPVAAYMQPPASRPVQTKNNSANNNTNNNNNVDLSSDATLIASDPALQEDSGDETEDDTKMKAGTGPSNEGPHSSPPQVIKSSPPMVSVVPPPPRQRSFNRQATPPTPSRPSTATANPVPSRKRNAAAMNDSGYFSSLESSAMRPDKARRISTSELDIEPPRIKRGRAEEEIARIRSSSHDVSPARPGVPKDTQHAASSPMRAQYISMAPTQPLSPEIKLTKTAASPTSLSPNTNLRNHRKKIRQMVNSPAKRVGLAGEPWSPAFKMADDPFPSFESAHGHLDIFTAFSPVKISTPNGSPAKRAVKHELLDTTSDSYDYNQNTLDIPTYDEKTFCGTPDPRKGKLKKGMKYAYESPVRKNNNDALHYVSGGSPEEFFSFDMFDDEPPNGELEGVDILQGFEKMNKSKHSPKRLLVPTCQMPRYKYT